MNKSLISYAALSILGLCLLLVGGYFYGVAKENALSAVLIGAGILLLGVFSDRLMASLSIKSSPEAQYYLEIEVNDERNRTIREKAGAKTNQFMNYTLCLLAIAFTLMHADLYVTLFLVCALLLQGALFILFTNQYRRRI